MMFGHWHALHRARARQLAGQHDAANLTLAEAERRLAIYARQADMPAIVAFFRAAIASLRGDRDVALKHLDQARQAGWRRHAQVRHSPLFTAFQADPRLDALQADPRLDALLIAVQQTVSGERTALAP